MSRALALVALVLGAFGSVIAQEVEITDPERPRKSYIPALNFAVGLTDRLDLNFYYWRFIGAIDGSEVQARLRYAFSERLGLNVRYYGFYQAATEGRPAPYDHRFRLEPTTALRLPGGFGFFGRARLEHRWRDLPNEWRLRPFLRVDHSVKVLGHEYLPYAYVELYYNFRTAVMSSVNPAVGFGTNLRPKLTLNVWTEYGNVRRPGADTWNTFVGLAWRVGHRWHPSEPEQQRAQ